MLDVHARFDVRLLRALALAAALLAPALVYAPKACAQVVALPAGINTRPQMGPQDEQAIAQFLDAQKAALLGNDVDAMRRARGEVLALLQPQGVSVSFRLTLGKGLVPILKQMIETGDDTKIINALRIAGELGTQPCVEVLTGKLGDPKTTIRLAAAAAANRLLEALWRQAPAMQPGPALTLVNAVAGQLKVETDPSASDPMIRAMESAQKLTDASFAEVRVAALKQLCGIMAEHVRGLGAKPTSDLVMANIIRAANTARDALSGTNGKSLPADVVKEAASLGGESVAYVARLLKAGNFPQIAQGEQAPAIASKLEQREAARQLVASAESVIFFARSVSEPQPPAATKLAESFKSGKGADDARFAEDALTLIGPQGALVKTYGFTADRFVK